MLKITNRFEQLLVKKQNKKREVKLNVCVYLYRIHIVIYGHDNITTTKYRKREKESFLKYLYAMLKLAILWRISFKIKSLHI